jgi:hypothetical protein
MNGVIQGLAMAREQKFTLSGVSFALRYLPFAMRFELDFDNGKGIIAKGIRIVRGSVLRLFSKKLGFDIICDGYFDVPFMIDDFETGKFWLEAIDNA